jgi:hypothetical protein
MSFGTLEERETKVLNIIQIHKDSGIQDENDHGLLMEKYVYYNDEDIFNTFTSFQESLTQSFNDGESYNIEDLSDFLAIKEVMRIKYPELVEPDIYLDGVQLD